MQSPPLPLMIGGGISRGQLIIEAVAGGELVNYSRGTRECSNINECTCPGVLVAISVSVNKSLGTH